jgi:nitrite reductase/ring-hydroxylating ferredoxin subunit
MIKKVFFTLFLCAFLSCGDEDNYIPETYVNFSILASEIGGVGNGIYTSNIYGVNGIIIYHKDINQYIAYERTCSYDPSEPCAIVNMNDIYTPTLLIDSCCNSKFLIEDGTPLEGPALLPLKQYQTSFDGVYINVFN